MAGRQVYVGSGRLGTTTAGVTGEALKQGHPGAFRALAIKILAREHAEGQRGVREQTNLFTAGNFRHSHLKRAVEQVIGVLDADHPGPVMLPGQPEVFVRSPWGFVGDSYVADFAFFDQLRQCAQCLFNGGRLLVHTVPVPQLAKEIGVTIRPVHLIEVDIIGLEPAQTVFTGLTNMVPGQARAIPEVTQSITRPRHFGSNHQIVATAPLRQPVAQIAFREALGFSPRGHRVHLRGIDEINALGGGQVQLLKRLLFGILLAPGHGAQANLAYINVGPAELAGFHAYSRI